MRDKKKMADLNDAFRKSGEGGMVVMTRGVQMQGEVYVSDILRRVKEFDGFTKDNDPYGEHDFGSLEYIGRKYLWKIDSLDTSCSYLSGDPANTEITRRVLTIMLAEEY